MTAFVPNALSAGFTSMTTMLFSALCVMCGLNLRAVMLHVIIVGAGLRSRSPEVKRDCQDMDPAFAFQRAAKSNNGIKLTRPQLECSR